MKVGTTPTAKGRGRRRSLYWLTGLPPAVNGAHLAGVTPTARVTPTAALGVNWAYADGIYTPTAALGQNRPKPTALGRRRTITGLTSLPVYTDGPDI